MPRYNDKLNQCVVWVEFLKEAFATFFITIKFFRRRRNTSFILKLLLFGPKAAFHYSISFRLFIYKEINLLIYDCNHHFSAHIISKLIHIQIDLIVPKEWKWKLWSHKIWFVLLTFFIVSCQHHREYIYIYIQGFRLEIPGVFECDTKKAQLEMHENNVKWIHFLI